jgi:plasmid stability protein
MLGYTKGTPMATLYVENVPDELYEALRERAKRERRSMAAEVIRILEVEIPTRSDIARRRAVMRGIEEIRAMSPIGDGPATDEMVREDRER